MILLVEDEAGIRDALCAFLRLQGYEVRGVGSAGAAREAMAGTTPRFLITDVDLGDGDGRELVDELLELDPEVQCLVLTARPSDSLADWIAMRKCIEAMQKPVRPARLVCWLESCENPSGGSPGGDNDGSDLGEEEERAVQALLGRFLHVASHPRVVRAWREGERVRLRLDAPPRSFRMRDLEPSFRRRLLELDLDLWPGAGGCTELGFKLQPLVAEKSEELAGFDSTRVGSALEKVHEGEACDVQVPDRQREPAASDGASGSLPGLPDGGLGRVDEERRLLWPDADLPGATFDANR